MCLFCHVPMQHLLRVIPVIGILWDRKAFNPTPSPAECTITADKGNPFGLGRLRETVNNRKRKESCASSSSSLSEMQEQFQAARRKLAEQDLINSQREAEQRIAQSRFSSLEMIVSYLKTNDPQFADFLARQPPIIPPETDQPLDKALYQPLDRALHQPLHKALHQPLHKALHQPKDIPCCSSLSFVQPAHEDDGHWTKSEECCQVEQSICLLNSEPPIDDMIEDDTTFLLYISITCILLSFEIYRGPTRDDSIFKRWHSVSIRSITFVNGEAIAECKNSHGPKRGNQGYFKASLDVMISDVYSNGSFKSPSRLFRNFVYGEVRKEYEGKEEVIGTPIDRALFKWAIELQAKMNITYNKSDSITLKGPCDKCLPCKKGVKSVPKVEAKGTAVEGKIPSLNGVRIHWKGKPEFILEKCLLDGAGKERILEAIKKMAAKNLICIAICTNSEMNQFVPDEDNRKQWELTCDRLDLLAVFGIQSPRILPKDALEKQAPLDFDEGDDDPSLDYLVDLVDSTICSSISSFEENMEGTPQVEDELFDLDWSSYPPTLVKSTWQYDYEIALFARYEDYYITFEATAPTSGSVFSFQTMLSNDYQYLTWGIGLTLASLAARIKATHGTESVDEVWDMAAIDDSYKGPMPKWFSDEALVRDDKKVYVVQESELHENDWLQLLMEVAFYSKTESGVSACKPLEIKKVVVQTLEEYTTEAREKLKADNAIFYISYKCIADPSTPWAGEHDAIIRKTMDGKPGHMSLEVAVTKEQIEDRET
ncbi:unnamed protein product [Arabidopsis lyrata]|nr:unnamed protein product [Arabidopsis lyrata]